MRTFVGGVIVVSDYHESLSNEKLEPLPPANDDDEINPERSWCTRFLSEVFPQRGYKRAILDIVKGTFLESDVIEKNSVRDTTYPMALGWDGGDAIDGPETGRMAQVHWSVSGIEHLKIVRSWTGNALGFRSCMWAEYTRKRGSGRKAGTVAGESR